MVLIMPSRRNSQSLLWRPRLRQVAFAAMLVALLAVGVGCGGGSNGGNTSTPETGTVTVQGIGPYTNHSVTISVTVD